MVADAERARGVSDSLLKELDPPLDISTLHQYPAEGVGHRRVVRLELVSALGGLQRARIFRLLVGPGEVIQYHDVVRLLLPEPFVMLDRTLVVAFLEAQVGHIQTNARIAGGFLEVAREARRTLLRLARLHVCG